MAEPNWSLENGSTKNWNEIFAFYCGPEARHFVYEGVAAIDGGKALKEALPQVLANGQDILLTQSWTEVDAAEVVTLLDHASRRLLEDALRQAAEADVEERPVASARAAGYWLAAAEAVASNTALAGKVEAILSGTPSAEALAAAARRVTKALKSILAEPR